MKQKMVERSLLGIAVIFIFLFGVVIMSGCIGQEEEEEYDAKVAIVFGTGGLGDKSFNDSAHRGLQWAQEAYNIEGDYVEPVEKAEFEGYIRDFAEDGSYDLIFSIGYDQGAPLDLIAPEYPEQKFAIIDMGVEQDNVRSIVFRANEGSALVGTAAGFLTETNKIGFIGGEEIPLIKAFRAGYKYGIEYVNPDAELVTAYTGHWFDVAIAKSHAEAQLAADVDVIYAAAGRSGLGVIEAVDATTDAYSIGVDDDQCYLSDRMAASMLKRVDRAVNWTIADVIEGTWSTGYWSLGLAEDGVGICEHADKFLSADQLATVDALKEAIIEGTVVLPEE